MLSCSQTHLRPRRVVCARPPSVLVPSFLPLSFLLFSVLLCSLLSSLSPRRLLQALWRICPNYLSYWQLRVNKPEKCVAFSLPSPPSLTFPPPHLDVISSHFNPPFSFCSIHHIFPPFFPSPSTSISPRCLYLLLSFSVSTLSVRWANYGEAWGVFMFFSFSSIGKTSLLLTVGNIACTEAGH